MTIDDGYTDDGFWDEDSSGEDSSGEDSAEEIIDEPQQYGADDTEAAG